MEIVSLQTSKSKLTLSLCLVWETERPYKDKHRKSPCFSFQNCEWYLQLQLGDGKDQHGRTRQDTHFNLYVVPTIKEKDFSAFMVKTYYKNGCTTTLFHKCFYVKPDQNIISNVEISELKKEVNFDLHGTLTIACVFDDACNSTKSQEQQSVYVPKMERPLSSTKSTQCPSSIPEDKTSCLENLSTDFDALLDSEALPDVQLMVESTSIPCHRAVLVARSKVFAAMFQHEMTESTSGVLEIKDTDLSTIRVFLKYLYSGKILIDLTENELINLFKSADKYEVHALKSECSKKMIKNINEENCLSYLSLAGTHNDEKLKDAVVWFIVRDDRIIKGSKWVKFSGENPTLAVKVYRTYVET